jgi:DNA-directed RNA polymerase specialized sigma24 family protein
MIWGVSDEARAAIRAAYLDGAAAEEIASAAGVSVAEAEIYLHWWCDRGCPGAEVEHP